jgi:hypothetical protein
MGRLSAWLSTIGMALGATSTLVLVPMNAWGQATIVQNRDEPGRNPYQIGAESGCDGKTNCVVTFPSVAASTRLVIDHASCYVVETYLNSRGIFESYLHTTINNTVRD